MKRKLPLRKAKRTQSPKQPKRRRNKQSHKGAEGKRAERFLPLLLYDDD
jgi:hypothetical protein